MKKKLSKVLQAAIKAYIDHRDNQANARWNKDEDCTNIKNVAFADGFVRVEQCCGSWWFSVRRGKSLWVFYVHEDNYTQTLVATRQTSGSNALSTLFSRA